MQVVLFLFSIAEAAVTPKPEKRCGFDRGQVGGRGGGGGGGGVPVPSDVLMMGVLLENGWGPGAGLLVVCLAK